MRLGWRPRAMLAAWCLLLLPTVTGVDPRGTRSLTALVGQDVVLDCPLNFPETQPVPYVIEWKKQRLNTPLYIWYDGYPPHVADGYVGRVSRVDVRNDRYGLASLNMTNITESDAGWYECVVRFLDRSPAAMGNGTWVHLDVHAPPRLVSAPPESLFVNVDDQQILACEASGTPEPTITWFKEDKPIQPSDVVAVKNDGTELRLSSISEADIGDYICFAENSEGRVHATTRLILAGGAVIVTSPTNQTRQEASQAAFVCEGRAMPANFSLRWLRDGVPVERHSGLERRFRVTDNGTLIIDPVAAEDAGLFTCEVSNGIGEPQRASAFLDVQYAAHVPYTPSVQYLPAGMEGVIACHIKANPAIQFVNWYRNGKEFEPKKVPGVTLLLNGSLLIETVRPEHQGVYRCRPFNLHGSSGESGQMQVVVREPPRFTLRPRTLYQRKVHDSIQMPCSVEGSPPPQVMWRRHDNQSLPSDRVSVNQGNITIKALRKSDFGFYECVARNSVATIVTSTQLVVEGTTPHAPHDLAANSSSYAITLRWLPGYSGGDRYTQQYAVWYRQQDQTDWSKYEVLPPGATRLTLYHLLPDTAYTLMVAASNDIGDGMFSEKVTVSTLDVGETPTPGPGVDPAASKKETLDDDGGLPKDGTGLGYFPAVFVPKGPKPGPPLDLKMEETADGFLLSWRRPTDNPEVEVRYYSIKFRPSDGEWKRLGSDRLTDTKYLITRLQAGRSYTFKVYAHSLSNFRDSAELRYQPSARIQQKAITAALVGGLLLLIVSIILSVCTVKICNKRKRRQQEKEYNMVACRVTDVRAGLHSPVPLKKYVRRVPRLIRHASLLLWRPRPSAGLSQSLMDELDLTPRRAKMVYSVEMEYSQPLAWIARTPDGRFVVNGGDDDGGFLSGGGGSRRRRRQLQPQPLQAAAYHLHQPGSPRTPAEHRLSHGFGRHQIPEQAPSVALSPDGRRFRASSPGPLAGQLGPFEFSDLSSVAVPNSVERTFPSTVLSSLSQLATPSFRERVGAAVPQETPLRRPDPRLPALRTIHEAAPAVADAGPQYENWPLTGRWRGPVAGPAHSRLPPLLPPLLRHPAALRDSGQHVHGVGHIEPPRIADIPRPRPRQRAQPVYANVWPPDQLFVSEPYRPEPYPAQPYQPGWYPADEYAAERYRPQRPLATSSPPPLPEVPHPRTFSRAEPQTPVPRPAAPVPAPAAAAAPEKPEESPSSSLGRTDRPLAYTRDRLQAAIGKVRSQLGLLRPASAPTLSRWPEESTTEPAALDKSSSSGVGSKNTSQRTHSSSGLSQQVSDSQLPSPQQGWQERPGTQLPPYLPPPAYLPPPQPLDISVDDHYEFDPVLTPGTESPALPAAVRSRGRPVPEMEARVQAMRQEFLQYRQRRARRHRSGENVVTETVC